MEGLDKTTPPPLNRKLPEPRGRDGGSLEAGGKRKSRKSSPNKSRKQSPSPEGTTSPKSKGKRAGSKYSRKKLKRTQMDESRQQNNTNIVIKFRKGEQGEPDRERSINSIDINEIRSSSSQRRQTRSLWQPDLRSLTITASRDRSDASQRSGTGAGDETYSEALRRRYDEAKNERFPEIRTVFKDIEANFMIESINDAQEMKKQF